MGAAAADCGVDNKPGEEQLTEDRRHQLGKPRGTDAACEIFKGGGKKMRNFVEEICSKISFLRRRLTKHGILEVGSWA